MTDGSSAALPPFLRAYKWTEEQSELLREMFEAGASRAKIAAEINQQFGTSYSPKAVIVRANTMGLRRPCGRNDVVWTDERKAELTRLIAAGCSFGQAGGLMGFSRSAISGQVGKLGLSQSGDNLTRLRAFARVLAELRKDGQRYARRMGKLMNWVPDKYRKEAPLMTTPEVVDDPLNLTMAQVGPFQCRWIMNDDCSAPLFCGHATTRKSWCERHANVALVAPSTDTGELDGSDGGGFIDARHRPRYVGLAVSRALEEGGADHEC